MYFFPRNEYITGRDWETKEISCKRTALCGKHSSVIEYYINLPSCGLSLLFILILALRVFSLGQFSSLYKNLQCAKFQFCLRAISLSVFFWFCVSPSLNKVVYYYNVIKCVALLSKYWMFRLSNQKDVRSLNREDQEANS